MANPPTQPQRSMVLTDFQRKVDSGKRHVHDYLTFEFPESKTHQYRVTQMFKYKEKNQPGQLISTAVYDETRSRDSLQFLSITPNAFALSPSTFLSTNTMSELPRNRQLLLDVLTKTINFDLKQREIRTLDLKPETQNVFKELLTNL